MCRLTYIHDVEHADKGCKARYRQAQALSGHRCSHHASLANTLSNKRFKNPVAKKQSDTSSIKLLDL